MLHKSSWLSQKSKRTAKSTAASEILAVGDAIDEDKNLPDTINLLLDKSLDLTVVTDSKDLYTSLSTQQN